MVVLPRGQRRILIVAAHPDDEVLGCGGTVPLLAKAGYEVHLTILGEGITSRSPTREQADPADLETLHAQSREVAGLLGAKGIELHGLPDNRFDTVPLLDVAKIVEEAVERLRPQAVYVHHAGDLNVDHQIANRAVLTATRPMLGSPVTEVYAFEVPSSTEWAFGRSSAVFRPNVFQDISDTLDLKIRALSVYAGEIRRFPHPRSKRAIQAAAHRWGSVAGCGAAEAFELLRAVRRQGPAD